MELRTLGYFLALAREGSLTNAAKVLHVTQPTLSRQLAGLERELGRSLFTRGHAGIELTEYGVMLAEYAESITALARKAEQDIKMPERSVAGCVHIAAGETDAMRYLSRAMTGVRGRYPGVTFELHSGTSLDLMDGLVRGQYDFMLECELQQHMNLNVLELPGQDRWGAIVRADDPLAVYDCVSAEDLVGRELIVSRQAQKVGSLRDWFGAAFDGLNVVGSYSLITNVRWMVEEGLGVALGMEGLLTLPDMPGNGSDLVFVPLDPRVETRRGLVWRKARLSDQAQVFLEDLQGILEGGGVAPEP